MAAVVGVVLAAGVAVAGDGWAVTYPLAGGLVGVTNGQANTTWVPVAVLWAFPQPTNAVLSVRRVSQGNSYVLGSYAISNGTSAVWVPEADYPFVFGETLEITSSVPVGYVQVIRKGG